MLTRGGDGRCEVTCGVGDRQERGASVEAGLSAQTVPGVFGRTSDHTKGRQALATVVTVERVCATDWIWGIRHSSSTGELFGVVCMGRVVPSRLARLGVSSPAVLLGPVPAWIEAQHAPASCISV
jgi:hypothetical protein